MAGRGAPSMGKCNSKTHVFCRRCGSRSFHAQHGICAKCGFGKTAKLRRYAWQTKVHGERAW